MRSSTWGCLNCGCDAAWHDTGGSCHRSVYKSDGKMTAGIEECECREYRRKDGYCGDPVAESDTSGQF